MERSGSGKDAGATRSERKRPRYVFQVDTSAERAVLRVLDTTSDEIFREIPIEEFLAYARRHKNVTPFLLGKLP